MTRDPRLNAFIAKLTMVDQISESERDRVPMLVQIDQNWGVLQMLRGLK